MHIKAAVDIRSILSIPYRASVFDGWFMGDVWRGHYKGVMGGRTEVHFFEGWWGSHMGKAFACHAKAWVSFPTWIQTVKPISGVPSPHSQ